MGEQGLTGMGNICYYTLPSPALQPAVKEKKQKKSEGVKDNYNENLHIRTRKGQCEAQVRRNNCESLWINNRHYIHWVQGLW